MICSALCRSSSRWSNSPVKRGLCRGLFEGPLVQAKQLKEVLVSSPDAIRVVDASHVENSKRGAKSEYLASHIPGSVFFDMKEIADKTQLPHIRLPRPGDFAHKVSDLGIDSSHSIVVYTTEGSYSAARAWWTFKAFGHESVYVLDGGLEAWRRERGAVESGKVTVKSTRPSKGLVPASGNLWLLGQKGFQSQLQPRCIATPRQVKAVVEGLEPGQIVDAREQHPSEGLVPGAVSVPYTSVLEKGDVTRFRSGEQIRKVFQNAGVDVNSPDAIIVCSISGVSAAVLTFALRLAGRCEELSPLYDGAWSE
ncbi:unnamed protein product [Chrysoparadoxa australica]